MENFTESSVAEQYTVHGAHCCGYHGCKYGDADCPVELQTERQMYLCEICPSEQGVVEEIAELEKLRVFVKAFNDSKSKG